MHLTRLVGRARLVERSNRARKIWESLSSGPRTKIGNLNKPARTTKNNLQKPMTIVCASSVKVFQRDGKKERRGILRPLLKGRGDRE